MISPRILVVDDDFNVREVLKRLLEKEGYKVMEAKDGKDALKCHKKAPADLIITDLFMPEKDGFEVINELNNISDNTKIIAISGGFLLDPENYLPLAETLGVQATFTKPINKYKLLSAVKYFVG